MHLIKTVLIVIFITALAVVVEAVTLSSVNKLEQVNEYKSGKKINKYKTRHSLF